MEEKVKQLEELENHKLKNAKNTNKLPSRDRFSKETKSLRKM
jgi:hypothetical protein